MSDGASIVIYYTDYFGEISILVGKESNYLKEQTMINNIRVNQKEIESFEKVEGDIPSAKRKFQKTAEDLSKKYGTEIRYDEVIQTGNNKCTTTFRCVIPGSYLGIVKGGKKPNETDSKDTIHREIQEEIGLIISKKLIKNILPLPHCVKGNGRKYDTFMYQVDLSGKTSFDTKILDRKMKHSGEMFDLEFKSLDDIKNNLANYNFYSKCALENFFSEKLKSKAQKAVHQTDDRSRKRKRSASQSRASQSPNRSRKRKKVSDSLEHSGGRKKQCK